MSRGWTALHSAAAAVIAQGLTALASVLVQVFAVRQLGSAGYGAFTVVNGVLLVVLAVQNGWVGDSLTVLDRWEPATRSALTVSLLAFVGVGFASCLLATVLLGYGPWSVGAAFGVMAATYLGAEFCRRVFMSRREFWPLSLNNLVFVAGTWAVLELQSHGDTQPGLGGFALAVAGGSAVAMAAALVQLPLAELTPGRLTLSGMGELSRFAVWRSAQIGVRPLALLGMRLVVALVAGRAAVGQIEAARLLMAPATTFTQGVGSFILPMYAAEARGEVGRQVNVLRVTSVVVGVTLALAAVPLAFPDQAQRLLTQDAFEVPLLALAGWALFSVAFAFGLPSANRLVARRMSREVLLVRLVDAAVGLAVVLLLAVAVSTAAAPFGLAAGALVGAFLTLRLSARQAPTAGPAVPAVGALR